MGVCRRIFKHYAPSELTICVTIRCEAPSPPRFVDWHISKPGCAPKIVPCTKGTTSPDERRSRTLRKSEKSFEKFDLLTTENVPQKMLRRKKKKSEPRYREFTETSINMYVEMNKQNVGEFVWDQQCTRIDALVAPILELDRTTTPEIPVEIELLS